MHEDIKLLVQKYVKACADHDSVKAHKIHAQIVRLSHNVVTAHELVRFMTPSVHAYGAVGSEHAHSV